MRPDMQQDEFEELRAQAFSGRQCQSLPSTPRLRPARLGSLRKKRAVHRDSPLVSSGNINDTDHTVKHISDSLEKVHITSKARCMSENNYNSLSPVSPLVHSSSHDTFQYKVDSLAFCESSPISPCFSPVGRFHRGTCYQSENDLNRDLSPCSPPALARTLNGRHRRSKSCRKPRTTPIEVDLADTKVRSRTSSMPTRNSLKRSRRLPIMSEQNRTTSNEEECPLYRVRSFATSSKGIVNRGDSFKRKSNTSVASVGSHNSGAEEFRELTGSTNSLGSGCSSGNAAGSYRVMMLGLNGVGKTALVQQFMTSEYMGTVDTDALEADSMKTVSVLLDGEESTLEFVDLPDEEEQETCEPVDAYVIVYSITDYESFQYADDLAHEIRAEEPKHTAVILVANKTDLVRARLVSTEEGKSIALTYDCKFIEVSAALNVKVDELLVGILSQIRLIPKRRSVRKKNRTRSNEDENNGCMHKAARGLLNKIFRKEAFISKSCDNLLVL